MNKLFQVFLYELQRNIRRKGYLFMTFAIPVLIFAGMIFFNFIATQGGDEEDAAPDPTDLVSQFESIDVAGYVDYAGVIPGVPESLEGRMVPFNSDDDARQAMASGDVDVYYVIREDYLETGDVVLHLPGVRLDLLNEQPIAVLIERTLAGDVDQQILRRLRDTANFQEYNLQRSAETDTASREDADFLMLYVFTLVFVMALFMTSGYLMQSVIEEKENRLIEILISAVTPFQLLGGKILALGTLGILQILVWLAGIFLAIRFAFELPAFQTLPILLNLDIRWNILPIMVLYFVLGYLFFAGLYAAIGAISNSMREGPQYAVFFTLPAVVPFYFFSLFASAPNDALPVFLSVFPMTSPLAMLMRLSITEVPLIELVISLALLALSALGAMWVAGRLFRVQTLLAGQTPKFRDLPKLVFGSA
ncbi:ABC transporter permease [Phototrophicus methaneseepsis]|uniref:ABC transporter permease n=1 Tax=Phototrophicus methaneseepsis TaxID=2710758 RepID=A0A7S8IDW3_9CHLR|nr:ABC transporter permease [Phototrophicus methaneseepsis]QPC81779.1 ABC transporter permease [Phototrophicus methaneseepsis]